MSGAAEALLEAAVARLGAPWRGAEVAVVLGSGLGEGAAGVTILESIPYAEVPGLGACAVAGHAGRLVLGELSGRRVVVFQGRRHFYEGLPMGQVALPARLAARLDCRGLALFSAVGAVDPGLGVGSWVFIRDHINLMGQNPLRGVSGPDGPAFTDLTSIYSVDIYEGLEESLRETEDLALQPAVLAAFSGPSYETPSEVRMAGLVGASVVGMSTVPEAVWGRHLGLRVVALGRVVNKAAGVGDSPLLHADVVARATAGAGQVAVLLRRLLKMWP